MNVANKFLKHASRGYFPALSWMATAFFSFFYVIGLVEFGYAEVTERAYSGRVLDRYVGGPRAEKRLGIGLVAKLTIQMSEGTPSQVLVHNSGNTPLFLDELIDALSRLKDGELVSVECFEVSGLDSGFWKSCRPWRITKSSGEVVLDISRDKVRSELIDVFSPGYGLLVLYFLIFVFAVSDIYFFKKQLSKGT